MEIEISVSGEEDVNIPADGATATFDNWDIEKLDIFERKRVREQLSDCFEEIFDQGKPNVMFEDEFPDEREEYKDYINNMDRDELLKTLLEDYDKQYGNR